VVVTGGALPLASSGHVATGRALARRSAEGHWSFAAARVWRAAAMAWHRCGYQLARSGFSVGSRVDARGLSAHGGVVVNPRAGSGRSDQRGACGVQIRRHAAFAVPGLQPLANYAFKPTAGLALRSYRCLAGRGGLMQR
jgi:hypothetical protein